MLCALIYSTYIYGMKQIENIKYLQLEYTYYNKQYKIYKIVKGVGIHYVIHDVHPSFQCNNLQTQKRNKCQMKMKCNKTEYSSDHYLEFGPVKQQSQVPGSHFQLCRWLVAQSPSFEILSWEWKALQVKFFFVVVQQVFWLLNNKWV